MIRLRAVSLLLILIPLSETLKTKIVLSERVLPKQEAALYCQELNMSLPYDSLLVDRTSHKGIKETWLAMRRVDYNFWFWLHVSKTASSIPYRTRGQCSTLRNTGLYALECFTLVEGYICHLLSCTRFYQDKCHRVKSGYLLVRSKISTWFSASSGCYRLNGSLMPEEYLETAINLLVDTEHDYWVGLTKSQWTWTTPTAEVPVRNFQWKSGLETVETNRCAIETKEAGGSMFWEVANCNNSYQFACITEYAEFEPESATEVYIEQPEVPGELKDVLIFTGIAVLFIFVITFVCAMMCRKYGSASRGNIPLPTNDFMFHSNRHVSMATIDDDNEEDYIDMSGAESVYSTMSQLGSMMAFSEPFEFGTERRTFTQCHQRSVSASALDVDNRTVKDVSLPTPKNISGNIFMHNTYFVDCTDADSSSGSDSLMSS